MNRPKKQVPDNQRSDISDLTVEEDLAAVVKGGPIYMHMRGIDGDVTGGGYEGPIQSSAGKAGYNLKPNPKV